MHFINGKQVMNCLKCVFVVSISLIVFIGCSKRELREVKYENGQLKEQYYVKLDYFENKYLKDGLYTGWYKNGQKEKEGEYKNGKEEGLWKWWYYSGEREAEGNLKDGKKEGPWTWWYDGPFNWKDSECTYKNGIKDGLYTGWHRNGEKSHEGTFKNGKKEGLWMERRYYGGKMREHTYMNGEEIRPIIQ